MTKRKARRLSVAVILTLLLISVCSMAAFASEIGRVDVDQTGSISVTMSDDGNAVGGGTLALYRVASVEEDSVYYGNFYYQFLPDFEDCDPDLLDDVSTSALADELADCVSKNSLTAYKTVKIGSDGKAEFSNLATGLYLIIETQAASGYELVNPFVVSIPLDVNGEWVYDVDASPKVELTPAPTGTITGTSLPQTGFILWRVLVIGGIGAVLFAVGYCINSRQKAKAINEYP